MKLRTSILTIALIVVTNYPSIYGILLDCSYAMTTLTPLGSVYTCTARPIFEANVNESVTAVYGMHQTGKGDLNVHALLIQSKNLQFVPTNIESFFPNIIAINLYDNRITTISNRHLSPFPNLQYLWLSSNQITSIDGDLFSGINSMRRIGFNSNNIRHVGHDLNLPIFGSVTVDFLLNTCINQSATTSAGVTSLILNLLRNCPPTISQIEDSLEKRQILFAHINSQIQGLVEHTDVVNDELATLRNEQEQLWGRIAYLESIIGNQLGSRTADQESIDTFQNDD